MALIENTLFGTVDKVKVAIDRLKAFEPEEGYYLCFSGGKDSQCIYHLAKEAGVKFDAHYNITGIDPPEVFRFIKYKYPDVKMDQHEVSFFRLLEKKGMPIRQKRWCCSELKEKGGIGRICITGVRRAESTKRKARMPFEIVTSKKEDKKLFNDNDEDRKLFENCMQKGKRVINPIIDWEDNDVWEYINSRNLEYCSLYDEGYKRIGCIACPNSSNRVKELERYPKFAENYKRAIGRFLIGYHQRCKEKGREPQWQTADEAFNWWLEIYVKEEEFEGQISLFEDDEEDDLCL